MGNKNVFLTKITSPQFAFIVCLAVGLLMIGLAIKG
jgi:hypothetical protein